MVDVGHGHDGRRLFRTSTSVVLAVAAAGLALSACSTAKGSAQPPPSTAPRTSTTTAPTTTTVPRAVPTTVSFSISQVKTGTGPASLAQFTVGSNAKEWDIDWVFNCSKTPTKTGTFAVTVVGHGAAATTTDAGVPTHTSSHGAGLVKNYDIGTFNLNVATACQWTVRVEVLT